MKTGIVYHEDFLLHEQHPLHPERRERLAYTDDQLAEEGIWSHPRIRRIEPRTASDAEVLAVHDEEYYRFLQKADEEGGIIDLDTLMPEHFLHTALLAAGGAIVAAEAVVAGDVTNSFAMVRPPGHHAGRASGAGFCYLNNVAIMVEALKREGFERVLILDWDAHHGNGTQEIFYEDSGVLFTSIHQSPFYPGTGAIEESGMGEGAGYTLNMPVPSGSSDDVYLFLLEEIVLSAAREYSPDFIVISAGQDNHFTDPLTGLALTARGYAEMMEKAVELADQVCEGRLVAVLEGGYSIEGGLPYINLGIIAAMAGMDCSNIREPRAYAGLLEQARDPMALNRVELMAGRLKHMQADYWNCFAGH